MKKLLIILALSVLSPIVYSDDAKPPVTAQQKPKVKKPCKEDQDPEKDNCRVVKKATIKKK